MPYCLAYLFDTIQQIPPDFFPCLSIRGTRLLQNDKNKKKSAKWRADFFLTGSVWE
jgi:hypothetical protein